MTKVFPEIEEHNNDYLPGLSRAGSNRSGLFVAPITKTSLDLCRPSSSANNCDTTL